MNRRLFQRDFVLVLAGQIISLFGNAALRLALPLYLLDQTGSAALFGAVSALAFLPMVALAPMGGMVADRLPKAKIMAALDFFTAALAAGVSLLLGSAPLILLLLAALMLLYGVQGLYSPTVQASLPLLAAPEDLLSANAAANLVNSLSSLLGPVIGSVLYGAFGLTSVLWVSAGCFLFSAGMELFIHIPHTVQARTGSLLATVRADFGISLRFLFRERPLLAKCAGFACACNLLLGALLTVGYPVLITQHLGLPSAFYGAAEGAAAVGGMLGGVAAGMLGQRLRIGHLGGLLGCCGGLLILMAVPLALDVPVLVSYGVLLACAMGEYALTAMCSILIMSFLQGETPERLMGKVFACCMVFSCCAQPAGQALYGLLFEALSAAPWQVLLLGAAASALAAVAARITLRQTGRGR